MRLPSRFSLIYYDFSTASSIMFLLGIGELWRNGRKKSIVDDLARSMSTAFNVSKVWLKTPENQERYLVESSKIEKGDKVVSTWEMSHCLTEHLALSSDGQSGFLTGESVPVQRTVGNTVFAGTVVEEGEITIRSRRLKETTVLTRLLLAIEESEKSLNRSWRES